MRVRRNFQILATLLRSTWGIPKCDPALTLSSDDEKKVLRDIRGKLETFLDAAIKSKSMSVGDSMSSPPSLHLLLSASSFFVGFLIYSRHCKRSDYKALEQSA